MFFYLFTFVLNLWHRKFVTADVTAVFVTADLKQYPSKTCVCGAFHRLSLMKPLTSGGYDYEPVSKQRDITSSTRCNQPRNLGQVRTTKIVSQT